MPGGAESVMPGIPADLDILTDLDEDRGEVDALARPAENFGGDAAVDETDPDSVGELTYPDSKGTDHSLSLIHISSRDLKTEEKAAPRANRLIQESSPYLLQHARQPVDWYPWGEEAFRRAREENKPVFLSIGYMACHWCHRMAEESFEDEAVAALLNQHFIPVKVDREVRPDRCV